MRSCKSHDNLLLTAKNTSSDISLFSTTLRFGSSNEIATVSNGSIANARITNCARSKNAIAHCMLKFHIRCQRDPHTMVSYRKGIESYVREKTHIWENIFFFRCEDVNSDLECATYHLAVRSRYTWQVSNRVLQFQGDLNTFCVSLAYKLHIHYDSPSTRSVTYYGGSLVDGGTKKCKDEFVARSNIKNDIKDVTGMFSRETGHDFFHEGGDGVDFVIPVGSLADISTPRASSKDRGEASLAVQDETAADKSKGASRAEDARKPNEVEAPNPAQSAASRSSDDSRFLCMLQESHDT
jgi:hypothetical protein